MDDKRVCIHEGDFSRGVGLPLPLREEATMREGQAHALRFWSNSPAEMQTLTKTNIAGKVQLMYNP